MSLVNKMLRDLDARHVGENERAALPAAVTPLAARQVRKSRPAFLVWAALGLALAAVAFAWQGLRSGEASAPVAVAHVPPPAPVAPPPQVAPAVPASTEAPPAAATATPVSAPVAPDQKPEAAGQVSASLRMAGELSVIPTPAPPPAPKASEKKAPEPKVVPPKPAPPKPAAPVAVAAPVEASAKPPAPVETRIEKQERVPTPAERAEAEYRRAAAAQRQGNSEAALAGYRAALDILAEHAGARQALAAHLIEVRRFDEAEEVLRKGTELAQSRLASALALARLKVERNQAAAALDILLRNSSAGESSAEYQGFAGAMLNRAGRSAEAVERYRQAARLAPGEGRWWAGLGISLDAAGKPAEARDAYQRARLSPDLPADLALHVDQRLR